MVNKSPSLAEDEIENLSFEKSGYKSAIGVSRFLMRSCGIWPKFGASTTPIDQYLFGFSILMLLLFINIPQTVQACKVFGNLNEFLNVMALGNIPVVIAVLKMANAKFHQNELEILIVSVSEDWENSTTKWEREIMWTQAKLSHRISIILTGLMTGTVVSYTLRNLYMLKFEGNRQMYFVGAFPWDSILSPGYEITWFLQFIAVTVALFAFCSVDAIFVTLVLHLRGQLTNLQLCFRQLGQLGLDNSLEKLIQRHHRVIQFADIMEDSFNLMFLLQMFTSLILLVLQSYLVVMIFSGEMSEDLLVYMPFMVYFTTSFTFSSFMYCYAADVIREESTLLGNAVFESSWHTMPMKQRKLLILLLMRMRKPLEFTAGKFFAMSLNLFCHMLSTAASYVSVLLAVQSN